MGDYPPQYYSPRARKYYRKRPSVAGGGGGASVGSWKELARTTLGSASETLEVTGIADKRYLMYLIDGRAVSSEFQTVLQTGNSSFDTGNNYSSRASNNGGAESTQTSFSYARLSPSTSLSDLFVVGYIANYSTKEKLGQSWSVKRETLGSANVPQRMDHVWKWTNTSNVIERLRINENGTGTINTNSEMVVLGYDPADTHTTTDNFWQELASVELSSAGDQISSGTISAKKYLWVQCWFKNDSASDITGLMRFNGDVGNNYTSRYSINGGADITRTSRTWVDSDGGSQEARFMNCFIVNNQSNEKLIIGHNVASNSSGSANAPNSREWVSKWTNTTNQITKIDLDQFLFELNFQLLKPFYTYQGE